MGDSETRGLERAASVGGSALEAARLKSAKGRVESALARVERELREESDARAAVPDAHITGWRSDEVKLAVTVRERYLQETGAKRLMPGEREQMAEAAVRIVAATRPAWLPRLEAHEREANETARIQAAAQEARLVRLEAEAPVALGRTCVREALARAEGTGTARGLSSGEIIALVWATRESEGVEHVQASHDVPKSYRYPVSYTAATAWLRPRGVLVQIRRTQTWGGRADTTALLMVPADLFAEGGAS